MIPAPEAGGLFFVVEELLLHTERIVHEFASFEGVVFMVMNFCGQQFDLVFVLIAAIVHFLTKRVHNGRCFGLENLLREKSVR